MLVVAGLWFFRYGQVFWFRVLFKAVRKLWRVKQSILLLILRAGIRVIKRVKVRTRVYWPSLGFRGYFEVRH